MSKLNDLVSVMDCCHSVYVLGVQVPAGTYYFGSFVSDFCKEYHRIISEIEDRASRRPIKRRVKRVRKQTINN